MNPLNIILTKIINDIPIEILNLVFLEDYRLYGGMQSISLESMIYKKVLQSSLLLDLDIECLYCIVMTIYIKSLMVI